MPDRIVIALCVPAAILLAALVIVFVRIVFLLNRKVAAMAIDFTGVQSSLSTLTNTVTAVSSTVSTLEAGSDSAADQATLDGVTSSLDGINTTLSNLVSTAG